MEITSIEPVAGSKKRYEVCLDGASSFLLYAGELRKYRLKAGEEIPAEVYHEIMQVLLPKRAKLRAMHLLQKKDYTEYQLREKLKSGSYPENLIDDALDYVKSYHYVDDERYARAYLADCLGRCSKKRICQDLLSRGIDKEVVSSVMEELFQEMDGEAAEIELAKTLLHKRHFDPKSADFQDSQKQMAYLMRKGFSSDVIREVMRTFLEE